MGKRILVTGAAGFIGSHLCALLLERGDEVVGLDNFDPYYAPTRKRQNVEEVRAGPGGIRFRLVEGDVRDAALVTRLAAGCAGIAHLAGLAGVRASVERPHEYVDVNVAGTLNVLEAARRHPGAQVVLASTSSAYGDASPPFSESHPADRPLAPYAATKRAAELLCHSYHHGHGVASTVVRLFTAYGPRNRPDMMAFKVLDSIFTGRAIPLFGNGELVRDWTYVGDVARGIVAALDRPLGYEIVNLGHGDPVPLREFVGEVERLAGRKANLVPAARLGSDAAATGADIEKARRLLGWEPRVGLAEGIEALFQWYVARIPGVRVSKPAARLGMVHGD